MNELKPCPFCGGEALLTEEDCYGYVSKDILVICEKCNLQFGFGSQFLYESEAIGAWNRRAKPENEPLVRCGECAKHQSPNCAAKHEQALMDFCSHGVRKPERSKGE